MFFIVLLIGVFTVAFWDYVKKKDRLNGFANAKITGPLSLPVLGCIIQSFGLGADTLLQYLGECFKYYGETFRFWILNEALVFTTDRECFESIMTSTVALKKGDLYQTLRPWLNDGLLLSSGKKWHSRRKIFTPAFHFKVLDQFVSIMDKHSVTLVEKLLPVADGKTVVDMVSRMCLAALDVISEAAMGVPVNAQADPDFPYVKALKRIVVKIPNRMFRVDRRYDWIFRILSPIEYESQKNDVKILHEFTINVIKERRATLEKSIQDGTYEPLALGENDVGSKKQMALLDILLQSSVDGKPLTNEDILEEVDTFMFEGDDTSTSMVSHALYCLSRNPKVQAKLFDEICEVMGRDRGAPITMKKLQELKYLECVIKEVLRLHPAVPLIGRKLEQDLNVNGRVFPANSSVYMVIFWAHRDPKYFPSPELFIPERFEDPDSPMKQNPYSYVPFSAGQRNCIGQRFAMLELKTMISKVMRYYEILPAGPEVNPTMNLILRSSTSIHVSYRPRVY